MINVIDKKKCCGCSACVQVCPKQCISFIEDEHGFCYPQANKDICINCGLCETVCPFSKQNAPRTPLQVYAAISPNEEIRLKSSSGGVFTILAEKILNEGGVIFGARYNHNWEVVHDFTDNIQGIGSFRGSKYVQSEIGNTYKQAREFLTKGRKVLFSGTSCQIAGLRKFLRKEYDNLITLDVVCHGVPSPRLWRDYIKTIAPVADITNINFKDKRTGWRDYSITISYGNKVFTESARRNKYMLSFLRNYTLRSSCFNCPAKDGKSGSDITLADLWGVQHIISNMDDNKGTSLVCCNTNKGKCLVDSVVLSATKVDYNLCIQYNPCLIRSTKEPKERESFWKEYGVNGITTLNMIKPQKVSFLKRIIKNMFFR